jgi:hypothetical protein
MSIRSLIGDQPVLKQDTAVRFDSNAFCSQAKKEHPDRRAFFRFVRYSIAVNASFSMPQTGHTQSSGRSSNAVPGAMPLSGSPISGSYI